jgi:hypothetical protein
MAKKSLKYKRMKGGDGEAPNGIIGYMLKPKIFGISVLNLISIFVVPALFVGVWASENFSTSFESIAIALLVAEFIYIGIILPIKYGYQMLPMRTIGSNGPQIKNRTWLPKMLQSWIGLLFILGCWVTAGLLFAMLFGGTGSNYATGILPGIASVGIVIVLLGFIDTYLTASKAVNVSGTTSRFISEDVYNGDVANGDRESNILPEYIENSENSPGTGDEYSELPANDILGLGRDSEFSVNDLGNSAGDVRDFSDQNADEIPPTGGRRHKRRRSRSNSRGQRRHK